MEKVTIKKEFLDDINYVESLWNRYKEELKRTDWCGNYRMTRKSKLRSLRLEIADTLLKLERNYGASLYDFEKLK